MNSNTPRINPDDPVQRVLLVAILFVVALIVYELLKRL